MTQASYRVVSGNIHVIMAMHAANTVYESLVSSFSPIRQPETCDKPNVTVAVVFIGTIYMKQKAKSKCLYLNTCACTATPRHADITLTYKHNNIHKHIF